MDADKGHKTPKPETKDFLTHGTASSISLIFAVPFASKRPTGMGVMKYSQDGRYSYSDCTDEENELGEFNPFTVTLSRPLFVEREYLQSQRINLDPQ